MVVVVDVAGARARLQPRINLWSARLIPCQEAARLLAGQDLAMFSFPLELSREFEKGVGLKNLREIE